MAVFTTTANVKEKRPTRAGRASDTCGEVVTKTIEFTIPAGTAANDTAVIGSLPANCAVLYCYMSANAASSANSTLALKTTTANAVFSAAAALVAANAAATFAARTVTTPLCTFSGDDTITATVATANQAAAVTVTTTIAYICLDAAASTYSTFTN